MGVVGDFCVARRQRCHRIASSSRLDLASQSPCARPIVLSPRAAKEYIDLLGTHSDHISLPMSERRNLFSGIADLIDREYGGRVLKHYETVLKLQRKR
jgi:hypothetical protein